MKIDHHIAVSTIISGTLYAVYESWELAIASFITGVFIDLDHVIDYILQHGLSFNMNDFFTYFYKEQHTKITLVFHAWEILFLLCAAAVLSEFNLMATGVLIGYGHHIVLDGIFNKAPFLSYSLIWRWKKGFDSKVIFPRDRDYNSMFLKR